MKQLLLLVNLALPSISAAQLINGSFEQDLTGWEWTCGTPVLISGGAPAAGSVFASKEQGQTQGCFPSYVYQRLDGLQNGDLVTMSGWVAAAQGVVPGMAAFGLGRLNDGSFQLEETALTAGELWSYLTLVDTVEIGSGDTALLVLNSGLVGGPIVPGAGYFDGFTLNTVLAVDDAASTSPATRYDPATNCLFISVGGDLIVSAQLRDAAGRLLNDRLPIHGASNTRVHFDALRPGVYIVALATANDMAVVRFVVP